MIHQTVKILNGAHVLGTVVIGRKSSIWYNAVIRGDIEEIKIGEYSNVQDNCVLHTSKGFPLNVGSYVSVGHASVIHGATVEDNCLIGMNATLLNGSEIGENSIVGAGSVVTQDKKFPKESLILGTPGKLIRKLEPAEIESIKDNALRYAELAGKY
ncbi:MAG: gamma carbonic anhydrase family protein [Methanobacterium sp.]|jgi:carbonic anhydrase/acetyltransferase-like protein (isoleucine patch superfamily)|nr:gamma carbonic anhydrase family protein [Methanobacterium sp.]